MMGRVLMMAMVWWLCASASWMSAEKDYIVRHLPLALEQQAKYQIPASITLAQALVESQAGRSELARRANNHFGIKCKEYWTGESYSKKDDDRNSEGKLISSCFRKYDDVEMSYRDRSIFLSRTTRYNPLFAEEVHSPFTWAKMLSELGYATDSRYASKLIRMIQRYDLQKYDGFNIFETDNEARNSKESIFLPADYSRGSGFLKIPNFESSGHQPPERTLNQSRQGQ